MAASSFSSIIILFFKTEKNENADILSLTNAIFFLFVKYLLSFRIFETKPKYTIKQLFIFAQRCLGDDRCLIKFYFITLFSLCLFVQILQILYLLRFMRLPDQEYLFFYTLSATNSSLSI